MYPLCHYGFPCLHLFVDEDFDPFCGYPHTSVVDLQEDDAPCNLIDSMSEMDCPLRGKIAIYPQIENMLGNICGACDGTGKECAGNCTQCGGTGHKTEEQIRHEEEEFDKEFKRIFRGRINRDGES